MESKQEINVTSTELALIENGDGEVTEELMTEEQIEKSLEEMTVDELLAKLDGLEVKHLANARKELLIEVLELKTLYTAKVYADAFAGMRHTMNLVGSLIKIGEAIIVNKRTCA